MFAFMLGALALTAVGPLAARSLASPVGTGQGAPCLRGLGGPRRAVAGLLFDRAGLRELHAVPADPPARPGHAADARLGGRDLELPAAPDVLARDGAVRQPVGARVHPSRVH